MKMRRKRESYKNVRQNSKDRGRLNSTVRNKISWNSNVSLNSKGVLRPNRKKKTLKLSRRNSSVKLRRFLKLNRER